MPRIKLDWLGYYLGLLLAILPLFMLIDMLFIIFTPLFTYHWNTQKKNIVDKSHSDGPVPSNFLGEQFKQIFFQSYFFRLKKSENTLLYGKDCVAEVVKVLSSMMIYTFSVKSCYTRRISSHSLSTPVICTFLKWND